MVEEILIISLIVIPKVLLLWKNTKIYSWNKFSLLLFIRYSILFYSIYYNYFKVYLFILFSADYFYICFINILKGKIYPNRYHPQLNSIHHILYRFIIILLDAKTVSWDLIILGNIVYGLIFLLT